MSRFIKGRPCLLFIQIVADMFGVQADEEISSGFQYQVVFTLYLLTNRFVEHSLQAQGDDIPHFSAINADKYDKKYDRTQPFFSDAAPRH
jgi:hypothetical protein